MSEMKEVYESSGYPSAARLYALLKKKGETVTHKQVEEFVASQEVAQLHRPRLTHKAEQHPITASDPQWDMQGDLIDMQKFYKDNDGYRWVLVLVDIFDRKMAAVALKNKEAATTLAGLQECFEKLGKPLKLTTDSGGEFAGVLDKYLKKEGVVHHKAEPQDHNVLGKVDRVVGTLKSMLYKTMHGKQTNRWTDHLDRIVGAYNTTPHASLGGQAPEEAGADVSSITKTRDLEYNRVLAARDKAAGKKQLEVGQWVRIMKRKELLNNRGFETRWSIKKYQIVKVDGLYFELDDGRRFRADMLHRVTPPNDPVEERKEELAEAKAEEKESRAPLAPGRAEVAGAAATRVDSQVSQEGRRNKTGQAKFEHKTENILKHKEGVSQDNVTRLLRERKPDNQLLHSKYGRINWS